MSAKPEVVGTIGLDEKVTLPASTIDAMVKEIERVGDLEAHIKRLEAQKRAIAARVAVEREEKTLIELRLSNQILSIHANYLDRITALEEAQNRTGNLLQPLVGLREEYERTKESVSGLLARENV